MRVLFILLLFLFLLSPRTDAATTTVEAEDITVLINMSTLDGAQPYTQSAGGGQYIEITDPETNGQADYNITVSTDDYDLTLYVYDADDGQSTVNVYNNFEWVQCAVEFGTCTIPGTKQIKYGLNGPFAYQYHTDSVLCDNSVFGDPEYGADKICYYGQGALIGSFTLDQDNWARRALTINSVNLVNGQTLRVEMLSEGGEHVKFDTLSISDIVVDGPAIDEVFIDVTWDAAAAQENVYGYNIYHGATAGTATTFKEEVGPVTSIQYDAAVDFAAAWNEQICFSVKARNICAESGQFDECLSASFATADCVTIIAEP